MIFGFNTDVKSGTTVYHVQSEPRENERMLETQVFVGGRCLGKRATSYDDVVYEPGSIETQLQDVLRAQHRLVVEAAREGRVEEVLGGVDPHPGLAVHWLNADSVFAEDGMVMRFRVTRSGQAVEGASLTSRIRVLHAAPIYSQAVTDATGTAEMKIALREHALHEADVLVEAVHAGKSAVHKFRLRKSR